ncbi:MAG: hypothetical protein KME45_22200 [Stenomitos rutilans HA7619-LM2]|nr:hypothetical protein [Stenomitos rutilans HA7619-LM2]
MSTVYKLGAAGRVAALSIVLWVLPKAWQRKDAIDWQRLAGETCFY